MDPTFHFVESELRSINERFGDQSMTKPAPFDSIGGGTHQDKDIYPIQRVRSFRAIESWGL